MFIFWRRPVEASRAFGVRPIAHFDDIQQLTNAAVGLGRCQAVELGEHPQVLADRQQAISRRLAARDHVDPRAHPIRLARDVVARHARGSGRRRQERRQNLDERRLAGPVRPEQAEDLARRHLQRHVRKGRERTSDPRRGRYVRPRWSVRSRTGWAWSGRARGSEDPRVRGSEGSANELTPANIRIGKTLALFRFLEPSDPRTLGPSHPQTFNREILQRPQRRLRIDTHHFPRRRPGRNQRHHDHQKGNAGEDPGIGQRESRKNMLLSPRLRP